MAIGEHNTKVIIVLAAGKSERFMDGPKQLAVLAGEGLLQGVLNKVTSVPYSAKICVLGSQSELIKKKVDFSDFEIVHNANYEEGIESSIHAGLSYAYSNYETADVILILGDQPLLDVSLLSRRFDLIKESQGCVCATKYSLKTYGPPIVLSCDHGKRLLKFIAKGGKSKHYLEEHADQLLFIEEPNARYDVDTVENLQEIEAILKT